MTVILYCFCMQLTSGMIEDLDSLLHSGREITTVYEELTKTLPNDHLDYDNVSYIPCICRLLKWTCTPCFFQQGTLHLLGRGRGY